MGGQFGGKMETRGLSFAVLLKVIPISRDTLFRVASIETLDTQTELMSLAPFWHLCAEYRSQDGK